MSLYSDKNVAAAAARLPNMASKDVRDLRDRAAQKGMAALVEACEAELKARPFEFSKEDATSFETMAEQVKGSDLFNAICIAFTQVRPPSPEEARVLRWMAAHPGGSYQEAEKAYGKRDLGLVIGHLVYDRYGCFRKFMSPDEDQSSVLISKDRTGGSVRYTLKPEALAAFRTSGVI